MKEKRVVLRCCYNLSGEYLPFEHNPLHGKTFNNVNVEITKETTFVECDVIKIEGYEPIECELVRQHKTADGTLLIFICQDWG